jgi:hypothetical protein
LLFSAYLLYGFIRPWISYRLRKDIEDFSDTPPIDKPDEPEEL